MIFCLKLMKKKVLEVLAKSPDIHASFSPKTRKGSTNLSPSASARIVIYDHDVFFMFIVKRTSQTPSTESWDMPISVQTRANHQYITIGVKISLSLLSVLIQQERRLPTHVCSRYWRVSFPRAGVQWLVSARLLRTVACKTSTRIGCETLSSFIRS